MVPLGLPHSVFLSWSEDDQDKALAFMAEKAKVCQTCGTREEEWEEDRDAYISDMKRCHGCERLEEERENIPEQDGKGVKVYLIRNSPDLETSDGLA